MEKHRIKNKDWEEIGQYDTEGRYRESNENIVAIEGCTIYFRMYSL